MKNDITNKLKQLSNENYKIENNENLKPKESSKDIQKNKNIINDNNDKNKIDKNLDYNNLNIDTISNSISDNMVNKYISTNDTSNQNTQQKIECNYSITELNKKINEKSIKKENYGVKTLDFIKEIKNNNSIYHLFGGFNNHLYLCGNNFNNIKRLDDDVDEIKGIIYNVSEININGPFNHDTNKLALSCVNGIYLFILDLSEGILNLKKNIHTYIEYSSLQLLGIDLNHHITFGNNGIILFKDFFDRIIKEKSYPIVKEPVYGGVSISKNIIVFVPNNILSQKEKSNKIIFYNVLSKIIIKEKEFDYSINLAKNDLGLMEYINNNKSHKLLLCACKKYKKIKIMGF